MSGIRLGSRELELVWKYFPKLCAAIKTRLEEQQKLARQRFTTLMENAVHEEPPPSLKEVIRRTGRAKGYISVTFPTQRAAIKARYREFQRKLATERKAEAKSRINQRVLELKAIGEFPPPMEIALACKANIGLKGTELTAVLREVRQETGIKYSHSGRRLNWKQ